MGHALFICVLFISLAIEEICTSEVELLFSRRVVVNGISTFIFRTELDVSVRTCTNECTFTKGCSLVTYHRLTHQCFLIEHNDSSTAATMVFSPGYVAGDMTTSKSPIDPCQNCSLYDSCSDGACKTRGCPPPELQDGIQIFGNVYNTGSNLTYRCDGTPLLDVNYHTCLADGTWTSSSNLSCCPDADKFQTGTLSDGTIVTYLLSSGLSLSQQKAFDHCTSICARLLQVTSKVKFLFFQQVVIGTEFDYWVDARRTVQSNPFLTSDGRSLPPASDKVVWEDDDRLCLSMKTSTGYRLDGKRCGGRIAFICEK